MGLNLPLLYFSQKPQRSIRNSTLREVPTVRLGAVQVMALSVKSREQTTHAAGFHV